MLGFGGSAVSSRSLPECPHHLLIQVSNRQLCHSICLQWTDVNATDDDAILSNRQAGKSPPRLEEEIASLTNIQDLGRLEELMLRLPELVGSSLSVNALREDLQVAHRTAASWLDALERLFAIFRPSPFDAPRIRAVKQERKHYHFDWSVVRDEGERFENLVACHLLKWVHFEQDVRGRDLELRFFRDVDRREVDFVVTEDRQPILFVECKLADRDINRGLRYLKARFPAAKAVQIALSGQRDFVTPSHIRVMPAASFLRSLI